MLARFAKHGMGAIRPLFGLRILADMMRVTSPEAQVFPKIDRHHGHQYHVTHISDMHHRPFLKLTHISKPSSASYLL